MDKPIARKKLRHPLLGLLLLVPLLWGLWRWIGYNPHEQVLRVDGARITVAQVVKGPFQEYIPVQGRAVPRNTIFLDAVEGGGVEEIYVESGAVLKAGDPILKLFNTDLMMSVMDREAELMQQSNNLRTTKLLLEQNMLALRTRYNEAALQHELAERDTARKRVLSQNGLVPLATYQDAMAETEALGKRMALVQAALEQEAQARALQIGELEASLARMNENVTRVRAKLEALTLRAPVDGHLTSLEAEVGQLKSAGEHLGQLDLPGGFKIRATVDEHYLMRIGPENIGRCTLDGETYSLTILKIFDEVRGGRFQVDFEFGDGNPPELKRGQTLQIRFELGHKSQVDLLPVGAFFQNTGGRWAYVLEEDMRAAVKRTLKIGRANPEHFEILAGLAPGEKVITSSYDQFGESDRLVFSSAIPNP